MKFVSYLKDGQDQLGFLHGDHLYDTDAAHPELPGNMEFFLQVWADALPYARQAFKVIEEEGFVRPRGIPLKDVDLLAPVPFPASIRDGYGFRQHVKTARLNRGVAMVPEFDQFPVFYFSNHHATLGPGPVRCMPDHFQRLDFDLEVAAVIARGGRNIRAQEADAHIGGFMIMNDFSARQLQAEEMKMNLGPAKGKDFGTSFGPWLVTPEELEAFRVPPPPGHEGACYRLNMSCRVNGIQVSQGNLGDLEWTFAELIERCSYGADLVPGDIIGSGTVGTGCFLELNGTALRENPLHVPQWLHPGDEVVLEVEGLGALTNRIEAEDTDLSLLSLKKIS